MTTLTAAGLLSAIFFLTLSAAFAGQPESSTEDAIVYIYRYKQFVGSALEPSIYCDDDELARMDNGRFFAVKLRPGAHILRSNDKQSGVRIEAKSGSEHYLRVELVPGAMKGHGRLVLVQKEQGAYEMAKLKPLGASKIRDHDRVSATAAGQ